MSILNGRKLKVLLLPDAHGWAFDNIASAIIRHNPYPDKIEYTKKIIRDRPIVNYDEWDYVFVFFEAEASIPVHKMKMVRGCYSAFWLEKPQYSPRRIGELFSQCRAAVFVNHVLATEVSAFLAPDIPHTIIYDSSDPEVFYPIANSKQTEFTAIFVGNIMRKIKHFDVIQRICHETKTKLLVAQNIPHDKLVNEYAKADICINFSDFEGGPQTFTESALCEVPMLIRSDNALAQIIPCFKGKDEYDFKKIIQKLRKNRNVCQCVGRQARRMVISNFT
jgi:hypothetical protein